MKDRFNIISDDEIFQICLVGHSESGKTSLLQRVCENKFDEEYDPSSTTDEGHFDVSRKGKYN